VGVEARGVGAAIGRDVHEELRAVGLGDDLDCGVVDDGAELDVKQGVSGREFLRFGEGVVEALHFDADQGSGVDASWFGCEREAGGADRFAVLTDDKAGGLRHGCGRSAEKNEGKKSRGGDQGARTHFFLIH